MVDAQNQRSPLFPGEPSDGGAYLSGAFATNERDIRPFDSCIGGIERINLNDVSGRARASVIQTDIDRDPVEPCAERGRTFEAAEAPVSANECVLSEVAGIFVIAREAVAKQVDVPLVPSNEHIERRAISRQTGRDQARIIEFVPVLG